MDEKERTLYVFQSDGHLVTHDGHVQLGCHHMTMEEFMSFDRGNVKFLETYWLPDIFSNRYQRYNFQAHQIVSGEKGVLEQPNNQPKNRLDRSV